MGKEVYIENVCMPLYRYAKCVCILITDVFLQSAKLCSPVVPPGLCGVKSPYIYPTECRQRGITYKGRLVTKLSFKINGSQLAVVEKDLGQIPIMVKVPVLLFSYHQCFACLCVVEIKIYIKYLVLLFLSIFCKSL